MIFSTVDPKGNPEERSEKGQFFFERSTLEKNKAKKKKSLSQRFLVDFKRKFKFYLHHFTSPQTEVNVELVQPPQQKMNCDR